MLKFEKKEVLIVTVYREPCKFPELRMGEVWRGK